MSDIDDRRLFNTRRSQRMPHLNTSPVKPCLKSSHLKHRSELGRLGEQLALHYFKGESYILEAKNWRGLSGEIDLIFYQNEILVIVEVRSTSSTWLERPAEATTLTKRRQVARCAHEYMTSRSMKAPRIFNVRFDVCGILIPSAAWTELHVHLSRESTQDEPNDPSDFKIPNGVMIDHIENAYYSPWAF